MGSWLRLDYHSRLGAHRHVCWLVPAGGAPVLPVADPARVRRLPIDCFRSDLAPLKLGRFYPSRMVSVTAVAPMFRVTALHGNAFDADFNLPLASLDARLDYGRDDGEGDGVVPPSAALQWPGMEAPLPERATDFDEPDAYGREDEEGDERFYAQPRRVMHIDAVCARRLTALYGELLAPGATVLDLMSGWRSHLPEGLGAVVGLGMNGDEMADNPQLDRALIHDLNAMPVLPFKDASFDAVVNTVSIEYLVHPEGVLSEVQRILRPGGCLIVTFSNRFFPPKVTHLWSRLHPMERLGWVLQTLAGAGFNSLATRVERGLARDPGDRYAGRLTEMDPLFAAWGRAG